MEEPIIRPNDIPRLFPPFSDKADFNDFIGCNALEAIFLAFRIAFVTSSKDFFSLLILFAELLTASDTFLNAVASDFIFPAFMLFFKRSYFFSSLSKSERLFISSSIESGFAVLLDANSRINSFVLAISC